MPLGIETAMHLCYVSLLNSNDAIVYTFIDKYLLQKDTLAGLKDFHTLMCLSVCFGSRTSYCLSHMPYVRI